jgi:hypothetical protein
MSKKPVANAMRIIIAIFFVIWLSHRPDEHSAYEAVIDFEPTSTTVRFPTERQIA